VATRNQQDFMIIARTDARTALGLDEALRRAEAYLAAGADALFVESPETETELRQIAEAFQGVPLVANMVAGGRTPMLPDQTLFELGFQLVIHPTYLLGALTSGLEQGLAHLVATGTENEQVAQFDRLNHWVDFESIWALDEED
jgi:2-methylisocitrate lyase-like PEP mutase family enzyme